MSSLNIAALRSAAMGDQADVPFQGEPVVVAYNETTNNFIAHVRPLETDRIRLVLGVKHNRKGDFWTMPATRAQAAGLSGVFGGRLDPTPEANAKVYELFESLNLKGDYDIGAHLYDFQQDGVTYLVQAKDALLGDEMGTGKTIQAIEYMRLMGNAHLVVAPNSMKHKWGEEIDKWWPSADVTVVDGNAPQRRSQIEGAFRGGDTVIVINYESLRTHTKLAPWGGKALTAKQKEPGELNDIQWSTVVVDEAHKIKDPKSIQTMAVKQMGLQASNRLAMTGTPLLNNPDDIWSIMNFVKPDEYGSRNQFRNRYCRMEVGYHSGFENTGLKTDTRKEFDSFFLPRFLRRTKREVLPQLPEKMAIDYRILPLTSKQKSVYNALVKDMLVSVDGELLSAENGLGLATRLRQVACGVPVVNEDGDVVALDSPSNKLTAILDILEGNPGEPIVIYAQSRKFIEMLGDALTGHKNKYRCGFVTGTQSAKERTKYIEQFQEGRLDVMLGTIGAGAEGITLTRASTIILAQQDWSHAKNAQAIDRVHRIGQSRGVQPIVLVSEGTIDVNVAKMDIEKQGRLQDLVRDPEFFKKVK